MVGLIKVRYSGIQVFPRVLRKVWIRGREVHTVVFVREQHEEDSTQLCTRGRIPVLKSTVEELDSFGQVNVDLLLRFGGALMVDLTQVVSRVRVAYTKKKRRNV